MRIVAGSEQTTVKANRIGIDVAGGPRRNLDHGIRDAGTQTAIVGTPDEPQVIADHPVGVRITGGEHHSLIGNWIGTDETGTTAQPNGTGVVVNGGSAIVGPSNVLSGNATDGLRVTSGAGDVEVHNNVVGSIAMPNGDNGIALIDTRSVDVAENTIAGNALNGVLINNANPPAGPVTGAAHHVSANTIQTNGGSGVRIVDSGGNRVDDDNTITDNANDGVTVVSGTDNAILENTIRDNFDRGIDLGDDGLTANDADDIDTGANLLQNHPRLGIPTAAGLPWTLDAAPSRTYRIELYSSTDCADGGTFARCDRGDDRRQRSGRGHVQAPAGAPGPLHRDRDPAALDRRPAAHDSDATPPSSQVAAWSHSLSRMEIGQIGIWRSRRRGTPAAAAEIEALGYGALWIGGSPSVDQTRPYLEASTTLPVITGILNVWQHDPADVAEAHARITADHPDRFLLGIGIGHPEATSDYKRPLKTMREFFDGLDAAATPVPKDERLAAALGPKMLDLAKRTLARHASLFRLGRAHPLRPRAARRRRAGRARGRGRRRPRARARPRHGARVREALPRPEQLHPQPARVRLHRGRRRRRRLRSPDRRRDPARQRRAGRRGDPRPPRGGRRSRLPAAARLGRADRGLPRAGGRAPVAEHGRHAAASGPRGRRALGASAPCGRPGS